MKSLLTIIPLSTISLLAGPAAGTYLSSHGNPALIVFSLIAIFGIARYFKDLIVEWTTGIPFSERNNPGYKKPSNVIDDLDSERMSTELQSRYANLWKALDGEDADISYLLKRIEWQKEYEKGMLKIQSRKHSKKEIRILPIS